MRADVVVSNTVDAEVIAREFAVLASCSDVTLDMFVDALLLSVIIDVVTDIGVDVFVDVNTNALAGVMTALKFAVPKLLAEFGC
jgi:hypothetical protein